MSYSGKNIWIVGASSGIGEALARELAARGATLALSARNLEKLAALNTSLGEKHVALALNVADFQSVTQAVQHLKTAFSHLDSVIFLAATYAPMSLQALDTEKVREIIAVNLLGAFHIVQATLPIFRQQGSGQLALCGSVAGYCGLPNGQPYSATKAGVMNLAESLRAEMAGMNVDVRLISPGFVATPMTAKNDFPMPMIISPETAARRIADGLLGQNFEIHFPKRFTYLMKMLRLMPARLYFYITRYTR